MNITTKVRPAPGPQWKPPIVTLESADLEKPSLLNWQFSELQARCAPVSPLAVDFFYLASVIYAADKLVP